MQAVDKRATPSADVHSSYERGCQEKNFSPPLGKTRVWWTYIQPHLMLRGVIGLVALARRTF